MEVPVSQESGETRLFKPEMVVLDKKGLTMADVMVGIGAGGEATLVIANHGAAPVQLPVGEIMGRLHPATIVGWPTAHHQATTHPNYCSGRSRGGTSPARRHCPGG